MVANVCGCRWWSGESDCCEAEQQDRTRASCLLEDADDATIMLEMG
jgi:hypothetical protein